MLPRKLVTMTVSATARLKLATTPPTATVVDRRMRRARSSASMDKGCCDKLLGIRPSTAPSNQGRAAMPPSSSKPTAIYAASGMPATGGIKARATLAASSASAGQIRGCASWLLPRPLSVAAGGKSMADLAGHQAPASVAITPSSPNTSAASGLHCKAGCTPAKKPPPRSPPSMCRASQASRLPRAIPAMLPSRPSTSASSSTSAMRWRGVAPSTASSANCGARWATLRASTENTRNAPVNKATSASTVRLTR